MQVTLIQVDERNEENVERFGEFTIARPAGNIPRLAIAFISVGEGLRWLGLQERQAMVASHERRLSLSDIVEIEPVLDPEEISAEMPPRHAQRVGRGLLPPVASSEFLAAVERLRPDLAPYIARLREREVARDFSDSGYEVTAMERDALGLALGFQGLDRAPLQRWAPGAEPEGFLRGLEGATLREDRMIENDLRIFGDWSIVAESAVGAVHYERDGASLTVVNVNREPVETALGVDLLYYHETFESFVLVQYKRMRGTGEDELYRPDGNLEQELEAMRQIKSQPPDPVDQYSYRLGPGVCYLKLCRPIVLDPYVKSLIEGMYLPLEYFDACEPTAVGPRGGRAYGYGTIPRHFNNTQFTSLVQDGWIGSNGHLTGHLHQLTEELVHRGDSVLLAVGAGRRRRPVRR